MSGIQVVFDDSEVTSALNQLLITGRDMSPVFDEFADFALSELAEQFQNSTDPYGFPWEKSERAIREAGQTLVDQTHLRDSFSVQKIKNGVIIGSNMVYAAIHQFGGKTGRGHKTTLPSRAMLPVDVWPTTWEEEMVTLLRKQIDQVV